MRKPSSSGNGVGELIDDLFDEEALSKHAVEAKKLHHLFNKSLGMKQKTRPATVSRNRRHPHTSSTAHLSASNSQGSSQPPDSTYASNGAPQTATRHAPLISRKSALQTAKTPARKLFQCEENIEETPRSASSHRLHSEANPLHSQREFGTQSTTLNGSFSSSFSSSNALPVSEYNRNGASSGASNAPQVATSNAPHSAPPDSPPNSSLNTTPHSPSSSPKTTPPLSYQKEANPNQLESKASYKAEKPQQDEEDEEDKERLEEISALKRDILENFPSVRCLYLVGVLWKTYFYDIIRSSIDRLRSSKKLIRKRRSLRVQSSWVGSENKEGEDIFASLKPLSDSIDEGIRDSIVFFEELYNSIIEKALSGDASILDVTKINVFLEQRSNSMEALYLLSKLRGICGDLYRLRFARFTKVLCCTRCVARWVSKPSAVLQRDAHFAYIIGEVHKDEEMRSKAKQSYRDSIWLFPFYGVWFSNFQMLKAENQSPLMAACRLLRVRQCIFPIDSTSDFPLFLEQHSLKKFFPSDYPKPGDEFKFFNQRFLRCCQIVFSKVSVELFPHAISCTREALRFFLSSSAEKMEKRCVQTVLTLICLLLDVTNTFHDLQEKAQAKNAAATMDSSIFYEDLLGLFYKPSAVDFRYSGSNERLTMCLQLFEEIIVDLIEFASSNYRLLAACALGVYWLRLNSTGFSGEGNEDAFKFLNLRRSLSFLAVRLEVHFAFTETFLGKALRFSLPYDELLVGLVPFPIRFPPEWDYRTSAVAKNVFNEGQALAGLPLSHTEGVSCIRDKLKLPDSLLLSSMELIPADLTWSSYAEKREGRKQDSHTSAENSLSSSSLQSDASPNTQSSSFDQLISKLSGNSLSQPDLAFVYAARLIYLAWNLSETANARLLDQSVFAVEPHSYSLQHQSVEARRYSHSHQRSYYTSNSRDCLMSRPASSERRMGSGHDMPFASSYNLLPFADHPMGGYAGEHSFIGKQPFTLGTQRKQQLVGGMGRNRGGYHGAGSMGVVSEGMGVPMITTNNVHGYEDDQKSAVFSLPGVEPKLRLAVPLSQQPAPSHPVTHKNVPSASLKVAAEWPWEGQTSSTRWSDTERVMGVRDVGGREIQDFGPNTQETSPNMQARAPRIQGPGPRSQGRRADFANETDSGHIAESDNSYNFPGTPFLPYFSQSEVEAPPSSSLHSSKSSGWWSKRQQSPSSGATSRKMMLNASLSFCSSGGDGYHHQLAFDATPNSTQGREFEAHSYGGSVDFDGASSLRNIDRSQMDRMVHHRQRQAGGGYSGGWGGRGGGKGPGNTRTLPRGGKVPHYPSSNLYSEARNYSDKVYASSDQVERLGASFQSVHSSRVAKLGDLTTQQEMVRVHAYEAEQASTNEVSFEGFDGKDKPQIEGDLKATPSREEAKDVVRASSTDPGVDLDASPEHNLPCKEEVKIPSSSMRRKEADSKTVFYLEKTSNATTSAPSEANGSIAHTSDAAVATASVKYITKAASNTFDSSSHALSSSESLKMPRTLQQRNQGPLAGQLVVIDGPNVAIRHGQLQKGTFSCAGIKIVVNYYLALGCKVLVFVPEFTLNYEEVAAAKRAIAINVKISQAKAPDSPTILRELRNSGLLTTTPPQDYDDSYAIQYALAHEGVIVTNDMYRDYVAKSERKDIAKSWMKAHLISYAFVEDEFFPNPDFVWPY